MYIVWIILVSVFLPSHTVFLFWETNMTHWGLLFFLFTCEYNPFEKGLYCYLKKSWKKNRRNLGCSLIYFSATPPLPELSLCSCSLIQINADMDHNHLKLRESQGKVL